jgi:glutamate racemase
MFDSGVGGLCVLRAIRGELPDEDLLYVADSQYAPYGERSAAIIQPRAIAIVEFFDAQGAKAAVVACNTATAAAVGALRSRFSLPIVAMEPAVKPAVTNTATGIVGVLATAHTLSSAKFLNLVDAHGGGVQVLIQPCPGLVERVEQGDLDSHETRTLVGRYVEPLLAKGADTLVLGCTHYPFLRRLIEEAAGSAVTVIDPTYAVARELRRRLDRAGLLARADRTGTERFWSSGALDCVQPVIAQLWQPNVTVEPLP